MKQLFYYKVAVFCAFAFIVGGFFVANEVQAAPGDVRVTVTRQGDDAALEGALVEIKCSGGDYTAFDGSPLTDASGQVIGAPPAGANCDSDEETINARVSLENYVTKNNEGGFIQGWFAASDPNEITLSAVEFAFSVYVADQFGTAIDTVDTIQFNGNAPTLQDPVETNRFYWADSSASGRELTIEKDGYVAFSTTNIGGKDISTSQAEQVLITLGNNAVCSGQISVATNCLGLEYGYVYPRIQNELGTNLSGVTLTAGSSNALCVEGVSGWYCPIPLFVFSSTEYNAVKDGYVTKTLSGGGVGIDDRGAHTDPQVVRGDITGVLFSHKFVIVDELGNNLTPDSVNAGTAAQACPLSANIAYCAILLADDNTLSNGAVVVKNGYVTSAAADVPLAGNRTIGASPQQLTTMTSTNGLDFSHRVVVKDELDNNLTPTSATAGAASVACTISGNNVYCPVQIGSDNILSNGFVVNRDGYVTTLAADVPLAGNRTLGTSAQQVTTMTTLNGLDFAVKAIITNGTAASVRTGNSLAVTCAENGVTGIYYCIVPLAHTATLVSASKSGFVSNSASFTDRTAASDAQRIVSFNLVVESSGTPIWVFTQQIPPVVSVVESPTPPKDIVTRINEEAALVFAQSDPSAYFKNTGTESTLILGSGERQAAISSFIEAYGKNPTTLADWIDILNIANGRWPITVNKTVEARAYINFRLVYGRNADMKNSTDVNALKMMGYGVRGAFPRNLNSERAAIARFKTIFGFNPTTARHWNIMRAIAYSGVEK